MRARDDCVLTPLIDARLAREPLAVMRGPSQALANGLEQLDWDQTE